jgi:hypothetical protein
MKTANSIFALGVLLVLGSCYSRKTDDGGVRAPSTQAAHDDTNQDRRPSDERGPISVLPRDAVVAKYLPSGPVKVAIYGPRGPGQFIEFSKRMEQAITKNPEWWRQFRAEHEGLVPYHPNLGLSEQEYKTWVELGKKQLVFAKAGESEIDFQRVADGDVRLVAAGPLAPLNGIQIRLGSNSVRTDYGELTDHSMTDATPEQRATGPWHAHQWQRRIGTPDDGKIITFSVGQHHSSGDGVLYYTVRTFRNRMIQDELLLFLRYPLPPQAENANRTSKAPRDTADGTRNVPTTWVWKPRCTAN